MDYIIAVPLDENLASFIGKKSSEDGIVFYNRKVDNDVIVALGPTNNEDKLYHSMAESMLFANQIIISTQRVDKLLGEAIVAASLLDKRVLLTADNDISALLAGNIIKDFDVCQKDVLFDRILLKKPEPNNGTTRIDLDHGFDVKGVGIVVLGIVTSGTVKVHDALYHSSGKQVTVKSIQSQDVDIESAGTNVRVGLCLKGIESSEIGKGDILYARPFKQTKRLSVKIKQSNLAKEQVFEGSRYLLVSGFSYSNVKVDKVEGGLATLSLERQLSVLEGDSFLLIRDKSPRIFASGTVETAS
ncbi:MAG: hypothetical protein KGH72_04850 [Candidatus Micrarchaeota archaeon]|nr:hypothetical protein [Candidatus Micrarchaeota archaeon]